MSAETTELFLYRTVKFENAKNILHVEPAKEPPRLLMDSHMHIQSGKCATLPFLHGKMPGGMDRSTIENLGTGKTAKTIQPVSPVGAFALDRMTSSIKPMAKQAAGNSYEVGRAFLQKAEALHTEFRSKEPYNRSTDLICCSAVMTMDMEYAHLAGYFGLRIYNPLFKRDEDRLQDKDPVAYWYLVEGTSGQTGPAGSPAAEPLSQEGETQAQFESLKKKREKEGVIGSLYDAKGNRIQSVPIHGRIKMAPKEETTLYEGWKKQLRYTKQATLEGQLKLLPMFHYDPRRWQSGDELAFREVGPGGLYLGFKMYTAQGYRPWDPRLPNLTGFYTRCENEGIPILNHCTPEGASTYDRDKYILFTHPQDTAYDEDQKAASLKPYERQADSLAGMSTLPYSYLDNPPPYLTENQKSELEARRKARRMLAAPMAAKDYFNENFVSPSAWRIVLDKHPALRLCLAHFGGNVKLGREWGLEIIRMMEEMKYPNFYADLSYSFVYKDFREHFKELLSKHRDIQDHVLFGTDWYMFLADGSDLVDYCRTAKDFLDGIDKKLWPKFTQENPYRFYRLGEQIGRVAGNILREMERVENKEASLFKGRVSKEAKPKEDRKAYRADIMKRKILIQDIAEASVN